MDMLAISHSPTKYLPCIDVAYTDHLLAFQASGPDTSHHCSGKLQLLVGWLYVLPCCYVQFADEHVDDKGDVLLTTQQEQLQWGLWLNTHKNPRFKLIDFGGLGVTVEVPKQIALANVAIRLQASN